MVETILTFIQENVQIKLNDVFHSNLNDNLHFLTEEKKKVLHIFINEKS